MAVNNPFLDVAARQIAAPVQARMRAARTRALRKALKERDDAHALWRVWRHERVERLLAGPYGADARALIEVLDRATLSSDFVGVVRRGPWPCADADTRFEILALIDTAIIALRERQKLPPFNDPIGDAPRDAFLQIRELLRDGRPPGDRPAIHHGEHVKGES
jgi:hypothetical protein